MAEFRWRAWFQRSREPIFLLNRHRRITFVNRAWEQLTGITADRAHHLPCRRRHVQPDDGWEALVQHALRPPDEARKGQPAHLHRRLPHADPSKRWWEIEFLPFTGEDGLLFLLGRITVLPSPLPPMASPLPEAAAGLRRSVARRYTLESLASEAPSGQRVGEQVRLAAATRVPVLLVGERGSGKHWVARCIHTASSDATRPFVCLDGARLVPSVLRTLLLGEGEGASVEAGTIYLRHPERLPRELQMRWCRMLVGEEDAGRHPRVVAGIRSPLDDVVRSGRLLEELACRLSPLMISLPALRDRWVDFPRLVAVLLARAGEAVGRAASGLTPATWDVLRGHSWPENLAELYRVLTSATGRANGGMIEPAHLPFTLRLERRPPDITPRLPLKILLEEAERRIITLALTKCQGNKSRAAEVLDIWRPYLLRRMEALGLTSPREKPEAPEA